MLRISFFYVFCIVCMPLAAPAALTKAAADSNRAALLINASNGRIIYQHNANIPRYPASLTKLMTAYLTFESLQQGNLRMDQKFVVSKHAAMQPPSKIYFRPGEVVRVKDLIRAVIISSANDAAVVVAEAIGGTEENFAKLMNKKAKEIGLKHTTFRNATGLHHPQHITTAYDMAKLAMEIYRRFPQYCHFFAETQYVLKNVRYRGGNTVTELYSHMVDGMKTGFTDAAGYNLISSALKDNVRIVGVVMGRFSAVERDSDMVMLLKKGFGQNTTAWPLIPSPVLKAQMSRRKIL